MNLHSTRKIAGAATTVALALSLALPGIAGAKGPQFPQGGNGVLTNDLPDISISVGYIGNKNWVGGGIVVLDDMGPVIATQIGPQNNMCRFVQMDYQPANYGDGDAGPSQTKVYRESTIVNVDNFAGGYLAANSLRPFETWQMDLKEGMNKVRVVMDANKSVFETNEQNTFVARLNVKLDCDGDGKIAGVKTNKKSFQAKPGQPKPDPVKPRKRRLGQRG